MLDLNVGLKFKKNLKRLALALDIISSANLFEGISADYLKIIGDPLKTKIRKLRYASRNDAMMVLEYGAVDIVIDDPGAPL